MKGKNFKELFRRKSVKIGSVVLAAAIVAGAVLWPRQPEVTEADLPVFVDVESSVSIEEDEVPLASAPKVSKSVKTRKTTKKIKLKSKSKKTYTKTSKPKTSRKTTKSSTRTQETTTKTETKTTVTSKFKKGSNINTQVTTVKTTITKSVVAKTRPVQSAASQNVQNGDISIASAAPKLDSRVSNAFSKMNFRVTVNSGVSYAGLFDARSQSITMKAINDTVYHEFGHFVAFAAGNADMSPAFQSIFNQEKSLYTESNKAYVLSSSSEYFAESYKNYTLNPTGLKASRPLTYAAMEDALSKLTDTQIARLNGLYGMIWSR